MSSFTKEDAAMFAPLGSAAQQTQLQTNPAKPHVNGQKDRQKQIEEQKIAALRIEEDLIDLSTLTSSKESGEKNSEEKSSKGAPEVMKQESDKKQQTMLSTLVQKKKELQKQKEAIEKLNNALQQLDIPATKEIQTLRTKIDAVDRELTKATKIRKQKEMELLTAINTVSQLADEKCALTERLRSVMYSFEATKKKKLEELEGELEQLKV